MKSQKKNFYKGIRQRAWGKWATEIHDPRKGVCVWLGTFNTTKEATRAYDRETCKIHGKKDKVNFPNKDDEYSSQACCKPSPPLRHTNPPFYQQNYGTTNTDNVPIGYDLNQVVSFPSNEFETIGALNTETFSVSSDENSGCWSGLEGAYSTIEFLVTNQNGNNHFKINVQKSIVDDLWSFNDEGINS